MSSERSAGIVLDRVDDSDTETYEPGTTGEEADGIPGAEIALLESLSATEIEHLPGIPGAAMKWGLDDVSDVQMEVSDGRPAKSSDEPPAPALTAEQEAYVMKYFYLVELLAWKVIKSRDDLNRSDLEDAMGSGYLALVTAAVHHDARRVNPQATTGAGYFGTCIRGGILNGIRDARGRIKDGTSNLKPSVMSGSARSLDAPIADGDDQSRLLEDIVASSGTQEKFDLSSLNTDLQRVLETVSERDREIFLRCTIGGQTQSEVGRIFGISQPVTGRIKEKVGKKVRENLAGYGDEAA